MVRIQSERGQKVVSTGIYGRIRHPLYLGGILMFLGGPLLLGSIYGFILGLLMSMSLVLRTIGEEKMLTEELEGYADYKKKVRYRLIPHVW
nr:isoprenylcysteine carboxylmethyltransferase family protein [Methanobacterium aggregans]